MAFLAFQELGGAAQVRALVARPATVEAGDQLTALEWLVVTLARRDGRGTLRPAGRLTRWARLFLRWSNPELADGRLETLRRTAVLAWHGGYAMPQSRVRAFVDAGFTLGQFETLVDHINAARRAPATAAAVV